VLLEAVTPEGHLLSEIQQFGSSSNSSCYQGSSTAPAPAAAAEMHDGQAVQGKVGSGRKSVSQWQVKPAGEAQGRRRDTAGWGRVEGGGAAARVADLPRKVAFGPSSLLQLAEQLGVLAVPTLTGTLPELLQHFGGDTEQQEAKMQMQEIAHCRAHTGGYGGFDSGSGSESLPDPLQQWKEARSAASAQHSNISSSGSGIGRRSLCAPTCEGWVLQEHDTQQRHKLISPAFKRVSHTGRLLHPLTVWDAIRNTGANQAELSAGLPPHFKRELQAVLDALQEQYSGAWQQLQEVVGVANSSAEAMQLLVDEVHALEQQQTRHPPEQLITGAYMPTGVPVPATLEAARAYGYVFGGGASCGAGGVGGDDPESVIGMMQTQLAGLDLEGQPDCVDGRSSIDCTTHQVLDGQGSGVEALCGSELTIRTEAVKATASSNNSSKFTSSSSSSSGSVVVPNAGPGSPIRPAVAPAGSTATGSSTPRFLVSHSALRNPSFRCLVRHMLQHPNSAASDAMHVPRPQRLPN
jgi:hypothetical protein